MKQFDREVTTVRATLSIGIEGLSPESTTVMLKIPTKDKLDWRQYTWILNIPGAKCYRVGSSFVDIVLVEDAQSGTVIGAAIAKIAHNAEIETDAIVLRFVPSVLNSFTPDASTEIIRMELIFTTIPDDIPLEYVIAPEDDMGMVRRRDDLLMV